MISEEVTVETADGLTLEAVLDSPGSPGSVLLLCHPHPQMGGTMNAPLLLALRDELVGRGRAVLRFNFRGIGQSEGTSGTGEAETADVRAGLALIRTRFPGLRLALGGWSFGAAVALRVACEGESVAACFAIAPPVTAQAGVTGGIPVPAACEASCPILVIVGANDNQVSASACQGWAGAIPTARYVKVPGANHFFWAKYEALAAQVASFLDETLEKEA
jgi:alpha/beta superfamily hydrolase